MTNRCQLALVLALLAASPSLPAAENAANAQVLAAIDASRTARGGKFPRGNCAGTLQIGTALPQGSAGFVVTESKFDAALGQAQFLLQSRSNHKAPPFYAWCAYQADSTDDSSTLKTGSMLSATGEEGTLGPVLVDTRRVARLYLRSQHSSAILSVQPLQSGRNGELIRVRLPLHGKMMQARVAGQDTLEAAF